MKSERNTWQYHTWNWIAAKSVLATLTPESLIIQQRELTIRALKFPLCLYSRKALWASLCFRFPRIQPLLRQNATYICAQYGCCLPSHQLLDPLWRCELLRHHRSNSGAERRWNSLVFGGSVRTEQRVGRWGCHHLQTRQEPMYSHVFVDQSSCCWNQNESMDDFESPSIKRFRVLYCLCNVSKLHDLEVITL